MNRYSILFLASALSIFVSSCDTYNYSPQKNVLWYSTPTEEWTEALPIGNGRIGAMIFGGTDMERIQLNEESLWGGSHIPNDNPGALENLPKIRRFILDGKIPEAFELAQENIAGIPGEFRSYQVLGDVYLHFTDEEKEITEYRRELDLESGVTSVSYMRGKTEVHYEMFASAPDNVIVIKMSADKPGPLDMGITLKRGRDVVIRAEKNCLLMHGQVIDTDDKILGPGGENMKFFAEIIADEYDGSITHTSDSLILSGGTELLLLITASTDYQLEGLNFNRSINPEKVSKDLLDKAVKLPYSKLKKRHIDDHTSLFNRVDFDLHTNNKLDSLPTDERLKRLQAGETDPELITTYFQYGRYLLIGSSRTPGQLPANLQGIWNEHLWAPWSSDYHVNINLQMNYWPAEVCNLSETVDPLINFMNEISVPGTQTAKSVYGADGWTMHHTTDIFGKTSVISGVYWGMFPLGGAWMTFPIWRHFEYTNDTAYLRDVAYPLMKGSAEFVQTFLFEDDEGYLVTAPTYSPENSYVDPASGKEFKLTYAPTMDMQIIRELFVNTQKAAEILGVDAEWSSQLQNILDRLPPIRVGADGTIMEWIKEYEEFEPGHRHVSHLLGLHPASQITPETPELFEAARKTLERRLEFGGGHTGWSRAWIINFYARLLDGEASYNHLNKLLTKSTLPNLFDTHPPFQIDGNFGGTAGIAEMLLQSHNGLIRILPALPKAWPAGSISGLKARGNFEVSIKWEGGELHELEIESLSGAPLKLQYGDKNLELPSKKGEKFSFNGELELI